MRYVNSSFVCLGDGCICLSKVCGDCLSIWCMFVYVVSVCGVFLHAVGEWGVHGCVGSASVCGVWL